MTPKKEANQIATDWIPGERVGPIQLGKPIESVKEKLQLQQVDYSSSELYEDPEDNWGINCEDGLIDLVTCKKWCFYKGKNLIGLNIKECLTVMEADPNLPVGYIEEWDNFSQYFYYVDALGAIIITEDDKIVVDVTATEIFAEDDETVIHPFREH